MASTETRITLRISRLWLWKVRASLWLAGVGVKAFNRLAADPKVIAR